MSASGRLLVRLLPLLILLSLAGTLGVVYNKLYLAKMSNIVSSCTDRVIYVNESASSSAPNSHRPSSSLAYSYTVVILAYRRPLSLQRTLNAFLNAKYDQRVDLRIVVDFAGVDASTAAKRENKEVRGLAREFFWPHGKKEVRFRVQNAGLRNSWLEAWYPTAETEIGILFEDDMEVSPLWFDYAKQTVTLFYQEPYTHTQLHHACLGSYDSNYCRTGPGYVKVWHTCQQGLIARPSSWRHFVDYALEAIRSNLDPTLPVAVEANAWVKKYFDGRVWTLLMFRYMYEHGLYNIGYCFPKGWGVNEADVASKRQQDRVGLVRWYEERGVNHVVGLVKPQPQLIGTPGLPLPADAYLKPRSTNFDDLPLITERWFRTEKDLLDHATKLANH